MAMGSDRPQVADLAFRVYDRALHPDWFGATAHRRVAADGWQADIRLVAGGHAISWRSGPARLTEVLAVPPADLPDLGLIFDSPILRERSTTLRPAPGIEYRACLEWERVDAEVFAHLSDEMTLDAGRDRLFRRESGADRLAPPAISHLAFESRAGGLLVHAFHTFPARRTIVRTQSLFEAPVVQPSPR